jgi:hypothetical protein
MRTVMQDKVRDIGSPECGWPNLSRREPMSQETAHHRQVRLGTGRHQAALAKEKIFIFPLHPTEIIARNWYGAGGDCLGLAQVSEQQCQGGPTGSVRWNPPPAGFEKDGDPLLVKLVQRQAPALHPLAQLGDYPNLAPPARQAVTLPRKQGGEACQVGCQRTDLQTLQVARPRIETMYHGIFSFLWFEFEKERTPG